MFVKLLTLLTLAGAAVAQDPEYFDTPLEAWSVDFSAMGLGNAVTRSPDGAYVYATAANGDFLVVGADGTGDTVYTPPAVGMLVPASTSGMSFASDYLVYAVSDGLFTSTEFCRVIALSFTGAEIWVSPQMEGACVGDPKVSSDGSLVFINTNTNAGAGVYDGRFNVLDATNGGMPMFRSEARDPIRPFGPAGFYPNPAFGAYTGGQGNTNDILVWSLALAPGEMTFCCGETFAFQMPPPPDDGNLTIVTLLPGPEAGAPMWNSMAEPILFRDGTSMIMSVTLSQFRAWNGNDLPRTFFDTRPSRNPLDYAQGTFRQQGTTVPVGLSSDPDAPLVYGPVAGNQLAAMDNLLQPRWAVDTTSPVASQPKVTPDDAYVFFSEEAGIIHGFSSDGALLWSVPRAASTFSDLDLSPDGTMLYFGDVLGTVTAWTIAGIPSEAPSMTPSRVPTPPTDAPTFAPTVSPAPSVAPVPPVAPSTPTEPPMEAPVTVTPATMEPTTSPTATPPTSSAYTMSVFSVLVGSIFAAIVL